MAKSNVTSFPADGEGEKDVGGVAGKRLKSFLERVERLETEILNVKHKPPPPTTY